MRLSVLENRGEWEAKFLFLMHHRADELPTASLTHGGTLISLDAPRTLVLRAKSWE
jgi:hypothetical protein